MGEVSEQWLQVVDSPVAAFLSVLNNQGIDFLGRCCFVASSRGNTSQIELDEIDESNDVLWVAVLVH